MTGPTPSRPNGHVLPAPVLHPHAIVAIAIAIAITMTIAIAIATRRAAVRCGAEGYFPTSWLLFERKTLLKTYAARLDAAVARHNRTVHTQGPPLQLAAART